jgi:hypothetical protein
LNAPAAIGGKLNVLVCAVADASDRAKTNHAKLFFVSWGCLLQIAIQRLAVKGNDDYFAAMAVVAVFLFLGHINHGKSNRGNMAVLNVNAGKFQFVPVIDGAVGM